MILKQIVYVQESFKQTFLEFGIYKVKYYQNLKATNSSLEWIIILKLKK